MNTSDRLGCLRKVPYADLFEALSPQTWTLVVNGEFISSWPSDLMEEGKDVAILSGANTVCCQQ